MEKTKISGVSARDPQIIKYKEKYYRCYTEDLTSVSVACGDSLEALLAAEGKKVFIPGEGLEYSKQIWAPDIVLCLSRQTASMSSSTDGKQKRPKFAGTRSICGTESWSRMKTAL